jgi:hypothetical protein
MLSIQNTDWKKHTRTFPFRLSRGGLVSSSHAESIPTSSRRCLPPGRSLFKCCSSASSTTPTVLQLVGMVPDTGLVLTLDTRSSRVEWRSSPSAAVSAAGSATSLFRAGAGNSFMERLELLLEPAWAAEQAGAHVPPAAIGALKLFPSISVKISAFVQ